MIIHYQGALANKQQRWAVMKQAAECASQTAAPGNVLS